jgi:L-2-hydroxyglutarate oxidase LhgO
MWCDCADEKQAERHHQPAARGGEEVSEQANAMTKQGFDQHNLLHLQWPQNCCLCRAETELAALRAENERLKARGIEGMQYRIAELEAALREAIPHLKDAAETASALGLREEARHIRGIANRAAAALKGEGE